MQRSAPYRAARKLTSLLAGRRPAIDRSTVVSLVPRGPSRGNVLLSYIIDGFLQAPAEPVPATHTNIWESLEIAKIFTDLDFCVDVIHYRNETFIPRKRYSIVLDVRHNLERLSPLLDKSCIKIMHLDTKNILFQNLAETKRLLSLQERKGVTLDPARSEMPNRGLEHAHCGISEGDRFTVETFKYAGKPIYTVPMPASLTYPWPEHKNFDACRRQFVWFGSSGFVLKGLDLVLDAFADRPHVHLTVCGPVDNQRERQFTRLYHKQLYETENIRTIGWVDVGSPLFQEIVDGCIATIMVSGSEGASGSSVNCMHAALIPILSYETGVISTDVESFGFVLKTSSISEIRDCVDHVSRLPAEELSSRSRHAWEYARAKHSRARFSVAYRQVLEEILVTYA